MTDAIASQRTSLMWIASKRKRPYPRNRHNPMNLEGDRRLKECCTRHTKALIAAEKKGANR